MREIAPIEPGHIGSFDLVIQCGAVVGRGVWIGVDEMLELVGDRPIGQKRDSLSEVSVSKACGLVAEEQSSMRPGEEFEAHGMDFAGFGRRPEKILEWFVEARVA